MKKLATISAAALMSLTLGDKTFYAEEISK